MKQIECPICNEMHDENEACPRCSFELHQFFTPSPHFEAIENERKKTHEKWWKDLNEQKVDRTKYEKKEEELNAANARIAELEQELKGGKKTVAFLITEQMAVYCLNEGTNTFGSAKINSNCEYHQKIILPGFKIRPIHFSIVCKPADRRYSFEINEIGADNPTLFINSRANTISENSPINDGDKIIYAIDDNVCKITFRKNIN